MRELMGGFWVDGWYTDAWTCGWVFVALMGGWMIGLINGCMDRWFGCNLAGWMNE